MPFVLFLLFGTWFLLILINDKGKKNTKIKEYYEEHPGLNRAEEVLLRHEFYQKYKKDEGRSDPIGDAIEDAGWQIYRQGHLPLVAFRGGMSSWRDNPEIRRRDEDNSKMNWRFPTLESLGGICPPELQQRWIMIAKQCATDLARNEGYGPKVVALEYVLSCYYHKHIQSVKRMAAENSCPVVCPADDRLLSNYFSWRTIINIGYTPSSWKLFHHATFLDFQTRFSPCWPPQQSVIDSLLREDKIAWESMDDTPVYKKRKVIDFTTYCNKIQNFTNSAQEITFDPRRFLWYPSCFQSLRLMKDPNINHWTHDLVAISAGDFGNSLAQEARMEFFDGLKRGHCCRCCYYCGATGQFSY